jgi:pilus assembly protein CpaB
MMLMSSRMLKILAWSLLVLAVVLGIYAYRLSQQPPAEERKPLAQAPESAQQAPYRAVIAVKSIEPGRPIPPEAVSVQPVWIKPEGGFERLDELAGRVPLHPIGVGEPVREKHFLLGGALAQKIAPGLRAVAVPVSEETAVGGFPQPGDRVDVVLYLPQSRENDAAQARVLLDQAPLLAIGEKFTQEGEGGALKTARTAVLAVPEEKVLEVALGVSAGAVRLALHPAEQVQPPAREGEEQGEHPAPADRAKERGAAGEKARVLTLAEFSATTPRKTAKPAVSAAPAPKPQVLIYRGAQRQTVTPP